jgi:hypothetical protein
MSKLMYKRVVGDVGFKDAEHWITLHPNGKGNGKGTPALINGAGQIIGGAGGKLNGKVVSPKSKSGERRGTESQHAPAIWLGPAKPEQKQTNASAGAGATAPATAPKPATAPATTAATAPKAPTVAPATAPKPSDVNPYARGTKESYEFEKARNEALSNNANQLTETAKTLEDEKAAMAAHLAAYNAWLPYKISRKLELAKHAMAYHAHKKQIAKLEKEAKKGQPKQKKQAPAGRSFADDTPESIHAKLSESWGLGFANGVKQGKATEYYRQQILREKSSDPAEMKKRLEEYNRLQEIERKDPGHRLRGHTSIDITQKTASAKAMREMITHVDNAMATLQASGFDVKKALSKANVKFVAGSTGKANGHAWGGGFGGAGNEGYFSISPSKRGSFNEEQAQRNDARMAAGQARWSISASAKDQTRATIVHELAHALGLRENVRSTERLVKVMDEVLPDKSKRREWIRQNISEYATTNINEFDAELAAMVTDPDYKRGTLPEQLEAHVDWLFEKVK